jgi:hypothetical protein
MYAHFPLGTDHHSHPKELETFLKTEGSETTGFQKSDGSGESIGHESGRKIVDILKRNPDKVDLVSLPSLPSFLPSFLPSLPLYLLNGVS